MIAPPPPAPVLEVHGLTVRRGETRILRGIDWTVLPGEMWTILGANGSGKTSLLSCLTGFLVPASGVVTVLGETYGQFDWTQLRKRIGLVSSSIRQMVEDGESVREIIGSGRYGQVNFWGKLTAADHAEIITVARRVRCMDLLERPWAVLSQGERQRVLTGRALIAQPELLILDEPCAGLDPVARDHFVRFIQSLAVRPKSPAIVLVTHHLEEIPPACTHVLALHGGKVHAAGPVREVLTSDHLSRVFAAPVRVHLKKDAWSLSVSPSGRRPPF